MKGRNNITYNNPSMKRRNNTTYEGGNTLDQGWGNQQAKVTSGLLGP